MDNTAAFDAMKDVFAQPTQYGCSLVEGTEGRCLDGGVQAPGGWQVGLRAVRTLLSGYAEVSLDHIQAGSRMVPTLDVYLDRTVAATGALKEMDGDVLCAGGSDFAVVIADDVSAPVQTQRTLLASPASLAGHLARAGMALPLAVKGLLDAGFCSEEIYWGHSSMPIVMRRADEGDAAFQSALRSAGQLVAVWLRCSDEELAAYMDSWRGDGELRLYNLRTGNTFLGGGIDDEALAAGVL